MSSNEISLVLQGVWAWSNPLCGQYFTVLFTFQTETLETRGEAVSVVGDGRYPLIEASCDESTYYVFDYTYLWRSKRKYATGRERDTFLLYVECVKCEDL